MKKIFALCAIFALILIPTSVLAAGNGGQSSGNTLGGQSAQISEQNQYGMNQNNGQAGNSGNGNSNTTGNGISTRTRSCDQSGSGTCDKTQNQKRLKDGTGTNCKGTCT